MIDSFSMIHNPYLTAADYRMLQSTSQAQLPSGSAFELAFAVNGSVLNNFQPDSFHYQLAADLPIIESEYFFLKNASISTSITDPSGIANSVLVFPNPTKNSISLEFGTNNFQEGSIYGIDGKIIMSIANINSGAAIDLSAFSVGIYFLELKFDEGSVVKKIIKE